MGPTHAVQGSCPHWRLWFSPSWSSARAGPCAPRRPVATASCRVAHSFLRANEDGDVGVEGVEFLGEQLIFQCVHTILLPRSPGLGQQVKPAGEFAGRSLRQNPFPAPPPTAQLPLVEQ